MRLHTTIVVVLLSSTLLSGCVWFGGKEEAIIVSPLPAIKNQFQPTIIWNCSVGGGIGDFYSNLHPTWKDTRVFAADRYGIVKAINIANGKEIWSTDLSIHTTFFSPHRSAQLSSGLTVSNNRVYVGSERAKIYALDAQNGSLTWEATVAGEVLSTPVVTDGLVLGHTSNGMLQALNADNGILKWTVHLDVPLLTLRGESAPTTALGGAVIVGGDNGRVSAVMIKQGQLIWQKRISHSSGATEISRINDVQTTPVVVNGVVYALAYNGNLAALDLRSGYIIWSREIGSSTNLLVHNSRIYLVDQNDFVIAIDTKSGMTLWCQRELLHRNLTSPVLYNGYIITGDSEGYLHWLHSDNGRFVAQKKVDSTGLLADLVIAGDKLIVQAKNGKVYAITC